MKTPEDIEDWLVLLAGAALGGTLVACFMDEWQYNKIWGVA
jgi:hypothetical protein